MSEYQNIESDPYERIHVRARGVQMVMVMAEREIEAGESLGRLSAHSWDSVFSFVGQAMDDIARDVHELSFAIREAR